jgi:hypothetical protein
MTSASAITFNVRTVVEILEANGRRPVKLEILEDEGYDILASAMLYLKDRADADAAEQETGEYEAYAELESAQGRIAQQYVCHECGDLVPKNHSYCSRNCYEASLI